MCGDLACHLLVVEHHLYRVAEDEDAYLLEEDGRTRVSVDPPGSVDVSLMKLVVPDRHPRGQKPGRCIKGITPRGGKGRGGHECAAECLP
jgi:hypothetical protein